MLAIAICVAMCLSGMACRAQREFTSNTTRVTGHLPAGSSGLSGAQANAKIDHDSTSHGPEAASHKTVSTPGAIEGTAQHSACPTSDEKMVADKSDKSTDVAPASYQAAVEMVDTPNPAPDPGCEMTFDEALDYALKNHPMLKVYQHEVQAAIARLVTAGLRPNPNFVLNTTTDLVDRNSTDLFGRVVFTLQTGGKRRFAQAAARAEITRSQWEMYQEMEAVIIEAAAASLEVLYLQELVALEGRLCETAKKLAELQRSRLNAQYADIVVADADVVQLELARLDTKTRLEISRLRLSRAIGQDPPRPLYVRGRLLVRPIYIMSLDNLFSMVEKHRPQIASAQAAIEQSRWQNSLARAKAIPDLELGPRYRETLDSNRDALGMRFQTDLPIFNRNQGGIEESAAKIQKNCSLYKVARLATLSDAAEAYTELLELQARLQYYRQQAVPLEEQTEKALKDVRIAPYQITELESRFVRLRLEELKLRYRYNQLLTQLEIFVGQPISEPQDEDEYPPIPQNHF
jgi:cobalt-zinc-cadmium efflux system outer membrane protein